jgi:hypothetical protein
MVSAVVGNTGLFGAPVAYDMWGGTGRFSISTCFICEYRRVYRPFRAVADGRMNRCDVATTVMACSR